MSIHASAADGDLAEEEQATLNARGVLYQQTRREAEEALAAARQSRVVEPAWATRAVQQRADGVAGKPRPKPSLPAFVQKKRPREDDQPGLHDDAASHADVASTSVQRVGEAPPDPALLATAASGSAAPNASPTSSSHPAPPPHAPPYVAANHNSAARAELSVAEAAALWEYRDDYGDAQGPFSAGKLMAWLHAGYVQPTRGVRPYNFNTATWPQPGAPAIRSVFTPMWEVPPFARLLSDVLPPPAPPAQAVEYLLSHGGALEAGGLDGTLVDTTATDTNTNTNTATELDAEPADAAWQTQAQEEAAAAVSIPWRWTEASDDSPEDVEEAALGPERRVEPPVSGTPPAGPVLEEGPLDGEERQVQQMSGEEEPEPLQEEASTEGPLPKSLQGEEPLQRTSGEGGGEVVSATPSVGPFPIEGPQPKPLEEDRQLQLTSGAAMPNTSSLGSLPVEGSQPLEEEERQLQQTSREECPQPTPLQEDATLPQANEEEGPTSREGVPAVHHVGTLVMDGLQPESLEEERTLQSTIGEEDPQPKLLQEGVPMEGPQLKSLREESTLQQDSGAGGAAASGTPPTGSVPIEAPQWKTLERLEEEATLQPTSHGEGSAAAPLHEDATLQQGSGAGGVAAGAPVRAATVATTASMNIGGGQPASINTGIDTRGRVAVAEGAREVGAAPTAATEAVVMVTAAAKEAAAATAAKEEAVATAAKEAAATAAKEAAAATAAKEAAAAAAAAAAVRGAAVGGTGATPVACTGPPTGIASTGTGGPTTGIAVSGGGARSGYFELATKDPRVGAGRWVAAQTEREPLCRCPYCRVLEQQVLYIYI